MLAVIGYVVIALAIIVMVWGLVTAIANKPRGQAQLVAVGVVEVAVIVQSVARIVALAQGFHPVSTVTTWGYLIGIMLITPAAWLWAATDRSRWSGLVLAVGGLAVAGMTLRLFALWAPAGA